VEPLTYRIEVTGGAVDWLVGDACLEQARAAVDEERRDQLDDGEVWVLVGEDFTTVGSTAARVDVSRRAVMEEGVYFTCYDHHSGRPMETVMLGWGELEAAARGGNPWEPVPVEERIIARFEARAWANQSVAPEGAVEWDATVAFSGLPGFYRAEVLEGLEAEDQVEDVEGYLKDDRLAPAWVREWSGPFALWLRHPVA
jgi:hypothetical protein